MQVSPNYCSLKNVFSDNTIYNVPMFQRAYSWEKNNVNQFCQDIEALYDHFKLDSSEDDQHFFGGIVCVRKTNKNPLDDRVVYELVDGQQRLSTTVIFVSRLIEILKNLHLDESKSNTRQIRINKYRSSFVEFTYEENGSEKFVQRITLSRRDKDFYYNYIVNNDEDYSADLKSHELIKGASLVIDKWLKNFFRDKDVDQILSESDVIFRVLSNQCKILMIKMSDVKDAYRLFQVINDRGRSLNAADLLRTASLGMYDSVAGREESVLIDLETKWDTISDGTQAAVNNKLIAYYTFKLGKALRQAAIFESFSKAFFDDASEVKDEIYELNKGVDLYSCIAEGRWPYKESSLLDFQKEKLSFLILGFKHTHSIPLLMSATKLSERKFYQMLYFLEKFFFIYKVALEKRMTPVTSLYMSTIVRINEDPEKYQPKEFHRKLKEILKEKVSGSEFEVFISKTDYVYKGDNKIIKYLLLNLEENYRYSLIDRVNPMMMLKMAFSGFGDSNSITIEHIYPRNSKQASLDDDMEGMKNKLGNLTLLYRKLNEELANSCFEEKKKEYGCSNLNLTKDLMSYEKFGIDEYNLRNQSSLKALKKIFYLGADL